VARKVGVDRHNLRKLLDGTTRHSRLWVLEGLARAGGTTVDKLRTLLPDGLTGEEAARLRMEAVGLAIRRKGAEARRKILQDPDSPYRADLVRRIQSPRVKRNARQALHALWNDPAWRSQQTQKIREATGTVGHRIRKAVGRAASGKTKLTQDEVLALVARQQAKFPAEVAGEIRALVLAEVKRRGLAPGGRPRKCDDVRFILTLQAQGKTLQEISRALGRDGTKADGDYLSRSFVHHHLRVCPACREFRASLS
jgi:hypothetical protein